MLRRQFTQLLDDLRAEVGRTNETGVRVADLAELKNAINSAYEQEFDDWAWPHLRRVHTRIDLAAGQRYYDFGSTMDWDAIESVAVWYNNLAIPVARGIGFEQYTVYDSESDERSDPVLRWDVRFTGSSEQIEVWPLPTAGTQKLQIIGDQKFARLVNDADVCLLDDRLVVMAAAQKIDKDRDRKLKREADLVQRRHRMRAAAAKQAKPVRVGNLGEASPMPAELTIRISPS